MDASWSCAPAPHLAENSCKGTAPSGSPIDTSVGSHTFTITAAVGAKPSGYEPIISTISYTVTSGNGGSSGGTGTTGTSTGGAGSQPTKPACAGLKGVKLAKCKLSVAHTKTIAECKRKKGPPAGQVHQGGRHCLPPRAEQARQTGAAQEEINPGRRWGHASGALGVAPERKRGGANGSVRCIAATAAQRRPHVCETIFE